VCTLYPTPPTPRTTEPVPEEITFPINCAIIGFNNTSRVCCNKRGK
jgi:hypothetical protein